MMNPKILIAAPTSKAKDYCFQDWSRNIKSFTYPDFDVLLVDNSIDKYYHRILKMQFNCEHIHPERGELYSETILKCQNYIRDYFLGHDYEYLFSIESDIFPPINAIEHLLNFKKDVIGLPYFTALGFQSRPLIFGINNFGLIREAKPMSFLKSFQFFDGKLKEVYQIGLGCLLIRRNVIEKIRFRIDKKDPIQAHADTYFHEDLYKAGIRCYLDTSTFSYHYNRSWKFIQQ